MNNTESKVGAFYEIGECLDGVHLLPPEDAVKNIAHAIKILLDACVKQEHEFNVELQKIVDFVNVGRRTDG